MRLHRLVVPLLAAVSLVACGSTVQVRGSAVVNGDLSSDPAVGATAPTGSLAATTAPASTLRPGGGPLSPGSSPLATASGIPAPGRTSSGGTGYGAIPEKGNGWDRKTVHIGVTTTSDIAAVGGTLGVHSVNPGNVAADAKAMVAYLNVQGGLFGRKVVPEFYDVRTADNGNTVGQAICTHFTQDVKVIALINMTTNGDTPNFDACVAKAHLPTMAWFTDTGDDAFFQTFHGFYNNLPFPSWSRFARPFVKRLVAQGYFTSWDNTVGGPGKAPVKIGLLEPGEPRGRQIGALLVKELTAAGHAPTDVIYFQAEKDLSSSEVKFRSDGITHVIGDELLFLFIETYESQHYRPRYGINSSNAPSLFLEGTMPPAQLVGSMGVGTTPTIDVFAANDPGQAAVPGVKLCSSIYRSGGVTYAPDQRYAFTNAYGICDGMRLIVAAAQQAGGLSGDQIRDGLGRVQRLVPTALTFGNGFSPLDRGLPGIGRDLRYFTECSCYRYTSGPYPL